MSRPVAKRSPSILVTDIRSARHSKYSQISVSNLTSGISDIPSSRQRETGPRVPHYLRSLPTRTSKATQKLVLIPDEEKKHEESTTDNIFQEVYERTPAEQLTKEQRDDYPRVTAYLIAEGFNLELTSTFLAENHSVLPRLYDEVLYIPYTLPLLPGENGFRVQSNNSLKMQRGIQLMEHFINQSEERDHNYEFYSGQDGESKKDHMSQSPNNEFNPMEPQFFVSASPTESIIEQEIRESMGGESETRKNSVTTITDDGDELTTNTNSKSATTKNSETSSNTRKNSFSKKSHLPDLTKHAEMFILDYGVVVFWNFNEFHEKNILADLAFAKIPSEGNINEELSLTIKPVPEHDIETEEFHFEYNKDVPTPRIYNDMITLKSGDHLIKLTISHAIAQSTKLSLFESKMSHILSSISKLPKTLALTGELQNYNTQRLLTKTGKLFQLRSEVNLSSNVLDTPEYFWTIEPGLHPLYNAIRDYLEIEGRVEVINDRCGVFLDFFDIVSNSLKEKKSTKVAKVIILAIGLSVFVGLIEILVRLVMFK